MPILYNLTIAEQKAIFACFQYYLWPIIIVYYSDSDPDMLTFDFRSAQTSPPSRNFFPFSNKIQTSSAEQSTTDDHDLNLDCSWDIVTQSAE